MEPASAEHAYAVQLGPYELDPVVTAVYAVLALAFVNRVWAIVKFGLNVYDRASRSDY